MISIEIFAFLVQVSRLASRIGQTRGIQSNRLQFQEAGVAKYLIILAPFAAGAGIVAYAK